jgi:hypothetical protein
VIVKFNPKQVILFYLELNLENTIIKVNDFQLISHKSIEKKSLTVQSKITKTLKNSIVKDQSKLNNNVDKNSKLEDKKEC